MKKTTKLLCGLLGVGFLLTGCATVSTIKNKDSELIFNGNSAVMINDSYLYMEIHLRTIQPLKMMPTIKHQQNFHILQDLKQEQNYLQKQKTILQKVWRLLRKKLRFTKRVLCLHLVIGSTILRQTERNLKMKMENLFNNLAIQHFTEANSMVIRRRLFTQLQQKFQKLKF